MANYSFISGAKFRPFSYQEMLQPLQAYTQEYNAIQEGVGDLESKSAVFDKLANEQSDPQSYAMYKQYSNDLAEQAELLARQGLTPASRQGLIDMRRRYSSEIIPIEQAYKRRQELVDEQRKLQAQDSTILFERPASSISLDELIANPALSPQPYSGALLTKQVGTAAQNLAKEVRENPRKWRAILGNQYYETIMQKGFRPEEVLQTIQNNPKASPILHSIVEDAVGSSGIQKWKNEDMLNRAYDYARQGLWNAIGTTEYQNLSNKAYDYAMRNKATRTEGAVESEEDNNLYSRAVPKTTIDEDKNTVQMSEDLKTIQEILNDPSLLNKQSKRIVGEPTYFSPDPQASFVMSNALGEPKEETYYPYQERLAELSKRYGDINYTITEGKLDRNNLAELAQQLSDDIRSSAVRSFVYKPNITQSDLIFQVLRENIRSYHRRSGNTGLWEIKNNKKGKQVDIDDLNKYLPPDADLDLDLDLGFIANSTDSKGKTRSTIIDTELLDDENRTLSKAQQSIKIALENGEDQLANKLIKDTMKVLYMRFYNLVKRPSNTSSKPQ